MMQSWNELAKQMSTCECTLCFCLLLLLLLMMMLQVVRYNLPRDVSALEAYACGDDATLDGCLQWSKSGDGRDIIVFNFGKHKGWCACIQPLSSVRVLVLFSSVLASCCELAAHGFQQLLQPASSLHATVGGLPDPASLLPCSAHALPGHLWCFLLLVCYHTLVCTACFYFIQAGLSSLLRHQTQVTLPG
jgi:hypothetical protein